MSENLPGLPGGPPLLNGHPKLVGQVTVVFFAEGTVLVPHLLMQLPPGAYRAAAELLEKLATQCRKQGSPLVVVP